MEMHSPEPTAKKRLIHEITIIQFMFPLVRDILWLTRNDGLLGGWVGGGLLEEVWGVCCIVLSTWQLIAV